MSKYVKGLLRAELEKKFSEVSDFLVIETKGVDGNENNQMRGELKSKGIKLRVVKNSAMRGALEDLGKKAAVNLFLVGPCTVAYGGDSVVDIAKELVEWSKKVGAINFKGAYIDGTTMDGEQAKALSKMPTRSELQGQIVQLAMSPGNRLVGAICSPGGIVAGCIKSLIDKLEEAA